MAGHPSASHGHAGDMPFRAVQMLASNSGRIGILEASGARAAALWIATYFLAQLAVVLPAVLSALLCPAAHASAAALHCYAGLANIALHEFL